MKICFTINPDRTKEEFESFYPLLEDNTFQAVELFYPYDRKKEQFDSYTECSKKISKMGKEMVLHLPHGINNGICRDVDLEKNSLQILKDGCTYASQFGVKKLTLHLGHIDNDHDRSYYIEKCLPNLMELCDHAKKYNQNIMIENMPGDGELGYSPDELLEIITRCNRPNLKFIYDTGHGHCSIYKDTDFIYKLKDYLYHLHYSDNDGSRDAHGPIGSGNIDFNAHFKALADINYDELHCMEILYHTADDLRRLVKGFDPYRNYNK